VQEETQNELEPTSNLMNIDETAQSPEILPEPSSSYPPPQALGGQPCLGSRLLQGNIENQINDFEIFDDVNNDRDDDDDNADVANNEIMQEALQRRLAAGKTTLSSKIPPNLISFIQKFTL